MAEPHWGDMMLSGRIIKGVGGLYFVDTDMGVFTCQARGLFRKQKKTPLVGDFVDILVIDESKKTGYLQNLKKRKNELIRPRAANIDQTIIVFAAASPSLNIDLLDRFIILVEKQNLDIVVCINKIDLSEEPLHRETLDIYLNIGYKTAYVSAYENTGIDALLKLMQGKVSILAGPSGVGKSSLINAILPDARLDIGEISRKIERGKHTTRHTEILKISDDSYIADSPGFASLTLEELKASSLQNYFREFRSFLGKCRFNDCLHLSEPGCVVKEHVGDIIAPSRYQSYVNFYEQCLQNVPYSYSGPPK